MELMVLSQKKLSQENEIKSQTYIALMYQNLSCKSIFLQHCFQPSTVHGFLLCSPEPGIPWVWCRILKLVLSLELGCL